MAIVDGWRCSPAGDAWICVCKRSSRVAGETVSTANPIYSRRRPAHSGCKSNVRAALRQKNGEAREIDAAIGEQRKVLSCRAARIGAPPWMGIAARTAAFRLRGVRSGGEDRQLAVSQSQRRVPAGARAAVPVCPWPVRGASWIRDNTPGMISRAGTGKPR